jgi:hypothetical protein
MMFPSRRDVWGHRTASRKEETDLDQALPMTIMAAIANLMQVSFLGA